MSNEEPKSAGTQTAPGYAPHPTAAPPPGYYAAPYAAGYSAPHGGMYAGPQYGQQPFYGPYAPQAYGPQPYGPQPYGPQAYGHAAPATHQGQMFMAGRGPEQPSIEAFGLSFEEKAVRMMFVRKVFLILSIQLMLTTAIVALFMFIEPLAEFIKVNRWLWIVSIILFLFTSLTLTCCGNLRRQYPLNYVLLMLFTLTAAMMLAFVCTFYNVRVIIMALGITIVICTLVSLSACICPVDITGCGCILLIMLLSFLLFSIIAVIVQLFIGPMPILQLIIGGIGTGLFSVFLMYDIQQIMGGRKIQISPEEHIVAVMQLYLDIILIFQYVLMLVGILDQN